MLRARIPGFQARQEIAGDRVASAANISIVSLLNVETVFDIRRCGP